MVLPVVIKKDKNKGFIVYSVFRLRRHMKLARGQSRWKWMTG